MDPSILYCKKKKINTPFEVNSIPNYYGQKVNKLPKIKYFDIVNNYNDSFYDPIRNKYSISIFDDRMGIVLANLDAVFHFSGCLDDYYLYRSYIAFDYNLINATVGAIQYLQFRSYTSFGHVYFDHLPEGTIDDRIEVIDNPNSAVNHQFSIYLLSKDGIVKDTILRNLSDNTDIGGDLILQIDLDNIPNMGLLFNLTLEYRNVFIIRPISLSPQDNSFFLIFRDHLPNGNDYYPEIPGVITVSKLPLNNSSESSFQLWFNNSIENIRYYLQYEAIVGPLYDVYSSHINWNIYAC